MNTTFNFYQFRYISFIIMLFTYIELNNNKKNGAWAIML